VLQRQISKQFVENLAPRKEAYDKDSSVKFSEEDEAWLVQHTRALEVLEPAYRTWRAAAEYARERREGGDVSEEPVVPKPEAPKPAVARPEAPTVEHVKGMDDKNPADAPAFEYRVVAEHRGDGSLLVYRTGGRAGAEDGYKEIIPIDLENQPGVYESSKRNTARWKDDPAEARDWYSENGYRFYGDDGSEEAGDPEGVEEPKVIGPEELLAPSAMSADDIKKELRGMKEATSRMDEKRRKERQELLELYSVIASGEAGAVVKKLKELEPSYKKLQDGDLTPEEAERVTILIGEARLAMDERGAGWWDEPNLNVGNMAKHNLTELYERLLIQPEAGRSAIIKRKFAEAGGEWHLTGMSHEERVAWIDEHTGDRSGHYGDKRSGVEFIRDYRERAVKSLEEQIERHQMHPDDPSQQLMVEKKQRILDHLNKTSDEELAEQITAVLRRYADDEDNQLVVQMPSGDRFDLFLEEGYKTTHEAKSDHSDPAIRRSYEVTQGVPQEVDPDLRPASGHVVSGARRRRVAERLADGTDTEGADPELHEGSHEKVSGDARIYGKIQIILNEEAKGRTKFGLGDSFNGSIRTAPMVDATDEELLDMALATDGGKGTHGADAKLERLVEAVVND